MQLAHMPTAATRELVAKCSGLGLPHESIAHLVDGIDDKTLRKHYRTELDIGRAKAHLAVASTLYDKACAGDTGAMVWWSKCQMRWSPPPAVVELSGLISISAALESATARLGIDAIDGECEDVTD